MLLKFLKRCFMASGKNNQGINAVIESLSKPILAEPVFALNSIASFLDKLTVEQPQAVRGSSDIGESYGLTIFEKNGLAVFNVSGALVAHHTEGYCGESVASYEGIGLLMQELVADPKVETIITRFNSGGGQASQVFDLADTIYGMRGAKRMIAMVDDSAYSAAYMIASAYDEIWTTRTGGVGSVGVVMMHVDQSKALQKNGLDVNFVYAGDKKVLGNSFEPLTDDSKEHLQVEVDRLYSLFTESVAKNRGMDVSAVVDTQAGTFHGADAVKAGFADKVGTLSDLFKSIESGTNDLEAEKVEAAKVEAAKVEAAKVEAAKVEADKVEAAKVEADKVEAAKVEADKVEAAKVEADKVEAAKVEADHNEIKLILQLADKTELLTDVIDSKMSPETLKKFLLNVEDNTGTIPSAARQKTQADQDKYNWRAAFSKVQR